MVGKTSKQIKNTSFSLLETLQQALVRRNVLSVSSHTNTYRLLWGDYEGIPGVNLDRYDTVVLMLYKPEVPETTRESLARWIWEQKGWAVALKCWGKSNSEAIQIGYGTLPEPLMVLENGKKFLIRFHEGFSTGLFLDLREQRARISPGKLFLNLFSYTSSFSVYAALQGYQTWSVDLSPKYIEWSKANFESNGIPLTQHFFYQGDAKDWVKRLKKKGLRFDYIVLDPPSFSTSKWGVFSVRQQLALLVQDVCDILAPQGKIQISSNLETWQKNHFQQEMRHSIREKRQILNEVWLEPALDFPLPAKIPFYLKCLTFEVQS
ncbi:MAG: class I SAM-dependent methyltransferase [Planctomycetota bacterium]